MGDFRCDGKLNQGDFEYSCNRRVYAFPGDVWTCPQCGKRHKIADEERGNGYQPVYTGDGYRFGGQ